MNDFLQTSIVFSETPAVAFINLYSIAGRAHFSMQIQRHKDYPIENTPEVF
jgi:hypothetical protein